MSNGNKEFILYVRNRNSAWSFIEETIDGTTSPKSFRTESAAQREGSLLLKGGEIDAFEIFKKVASHR